jgi:hypothetical protein
MFFTKILIYKSKIFTFFKIFFLGAFFVLLSYFTCTMAALLFMKLAHIIEVGLPHAAQDAAPLPGPITVCIQADPGEKCDFDDVELRKSPSPGRADA